MKQAAKQPTVASAIPVGKPPTDEQAQLVALFNTLETQQLDFLDQAGKRIIELSTGLLGILFAVIAFGDKFPPAYLQGNLPAKGLTVATVVLYLVAIIVAVLGVQPRNYERYRHNLSNASRLDAHGELQNTLGESRWRAVRAGHTGAHWVDRRAGMECLTGSSFISVVCFVVLHLFWMRFLEAYLSSWIVTALSLASDVGETERSRV